VGERWRRRSGEGSGVESLRWPKLGRARDRMTEDVAAAGFCVVDGGRGRTSVYRSTATSCLPFSAEELALLYTRRALTRVPRHSGESASAGEEGDGGTSRSVEKDYRVKANSREKATIAHSGGGRRSGWRAGRERARGRSSAHQDWQGACYSDPRGRRPRGARARTPRAIRTVARCPSGMWSELSVSATRRRRTPRSRRASR
jgi:hypothetical protein